MVAATKILRSLDKDQRDVLISTSLIFVIAMVISRFLALDLLLFFILMPLQFFITKFFFASKAVKKKGTYKDLRSNKRFKKDVGSSFFVLGMALFMTCFLAAAFSQHTSILLEYVFMFLPLIITRTIVFCLKFPLSALYEIKFKASDNGTFVKQHNQWIQNIYAEKHKKDMHFLTDTYLNPVYRSLPCNTFNPRN